MPDELQGNVIHAFCILKQGYDPSKRFGRSARARGHEMGPIAKPAHVEFVDSLPKTRSGKIMRRVLRAQTLGEDVGDLSTLAD